MQTLHFEDRDWFAREFVRDENGRVVPREDYEAMLEFKEILDLHNKNHQVRTMRGVMTATLYGGLIWGIAMLLNGVL
ncbi:MAG: hypothetical protein KDD67_07355 [Ignavibacteriae bacterium]|nr:hypothetical protein [Ignavibacteriota bacterium]MCB9217283.1 hypothetical protein [Ignavibacteria bacterium]